MPGGETQIRFQQSRQIPKPLALSGARPEEVDEVIDADASRVKEEVHRVARRYDNKVFVVANARAGSPAVVA